jgi:hypothetical protein
MPGAASSRLIATSDFPLVGRVHVRQKSGDTVHWCGGHGLGRAIIQTPGFVVLTHSCQGWWIAGPWHALIDGLKACNVVPTRLAESITGHSSGGSDFNTYGTVGYTLEQKRDVLLRVLV